MNMQRLLVVSVLALALSALVVPVALADGGPHGDFTDTTPACAGCHRAHTGRGDNLLLADTQLAFCYTCHGTGGLGAATNVQDGVWMDPTTRQDPYGSDPNYANNVVGRGLKGGGFDNTRMSTDLSTTGVFSTTSEHRVEVSNVRMWGDGVLGSGAGLTVTLQCTSCHDPHGTGNYRILRTTPTISGGTVTGSATVTDPVSKTYTISSDTGRYYGEDYGDTDIQDLSDWCGTCHTRIHGNSWDSPQSGEDIYTYIHTTTGANVTEDATSGAPACLTCHVVHGSSAAAEGLAGQVEEPGNDPFTGTPIGSALLRVDNRGVCQLCHNK